ncbi:MAG: DEAD/DEAH box helicase [Acidaminococcaceae bacterium]
MDVAELRNGIEAGFIDFQYPAEERYLPRILTNNHGRQTKVLDSILSELEQCSEFAFSVAFITNSGIACLIDVLKKLETKGVKGRILASQYQNFTEPRALRRLIALKNIELKIVTDENFHAKGYLFRKAEMLQQDADEYTIIVGSSNLTQNALSKNNEWNVKLTAGENGYLLIQAYAEFNAVFLRSTTVNEDWITAYEEIYEKNKSSRQSSRQEILLLNKINPNKMQVEALKGIEALRRQEQERGLLISATGTGKTYLSAFDVRRVKPKKFLFVVHRELIAAEAKASYQRVLGAEAELAMYTGSNKGKAPYLFATIQTLSKDENLYCFARDEFDYIVVDEVHHSGAETYKKVLDYFQPKFLLGMTATPERTDGEDIFQRFHHNIAYEIRLHQALAENMLVPFHYHGISDIAVNNQEITETAGFSLLTCAERVKQVLYYAQFYGCDVGRVKGLVFCSRVEEANYFAAEFRRAGYRAQALSGATTDLERKACIERLETDELPVQEQLDYIFTVDIFNEGVDIPAINQIIMLRPTQSAIIFVQQLGRGLRKLANKSYLEVIDFIGNYNNNFLVPIALYGDRSFNKDKVRRALTNNYIPGASTVYFEDIAKEKVFNAINAGKFSLLVKLLADYKLMKYQLGRQPQMMDFVKFGGRDPYTFISTKYPSYYEFVCKAEQQAGVLPGAEKQSLAFLSREIGNGRRIEEVLLLQNLLVQESVTFATLQAQMQSQYGLDLAEEVMVSVVNYINRNFFTQAEQIKYGREDYVVGNAGCYQLTPYLRQLLTNKLYKSYVQDLLDYAQAAFDGVYVKEQYRQGFQLYQKYSRKDVCRIMLWPEDNASTMYGYRIKNNTCPIFVTYDKKEAITESTKYEDRFLSCKEFNWLTRNRVKLDSREVIALQKTVTRIPLFVKKSDDEGAELYYVGDLAPKCFRETTIKNNDGNILPIVNIVFELKDCLPEKMYNYFEG